MESYVIKRNHDGMYVARPGSQRSYTKDRALAAEFTIEQARRAVCENESIWHDSVTLRYIPTTSTACTG